MTYMALTFGWGGNSELPRVFLNACVEFAGVFVFGKVAGCASLENGASLGLLVATDVVQPVQARL